MMSELVWVAVISAGAALITALLTQTLATRAASRQADRSERSQALQWQRSEASAREELARKEAREALAWQRAETQRAQALRDARLRELWTEVLAARALMLALLERVPVRGRTNRKFADAPDPAMPSDAAAQVCAVALLRLADARPSAKTFYEATVRLQLLLQKLIQAAGDDADQGRLAELAAQWNDAYEKLEAVVTTLADSMPQVTPTQ